MTFLIDFPKGTYINQIPIQTRNPGAKGVCMISTGILERSLRDQTLIEAPKSTGMALFLNERVKENITYRPDSERPKSKRQGRCIIHDQR